MNTFGLYIHWPFCISKCPYCDFNSHVRASIEENTWSSALLRELSYVGQKTQGRRLTSVFFGGGTPSLMAPQTVEKLINTFGKYWQLDSNLEITLEANPNSVDLTKFQAFKSAGINRLSLGIQSLYDADLKFLGRSHGRQEALQALEIASATFDSYSFDLIYGRPDQTLVAWQLELQEALFFAHDHLSLYQLTIEPGTAFYTAFNRGDWQLPSEDLAADLYEMTSQTLALQGFKTYEISNYAKPGKECQHNLLYWRYGDFAGIGPGAHGRLILEGQRYATKCLRAPETWLHAVEQQGHGSESTELLDQETQLTEMILMGLRLHEGIPLVRFQQISGVAFEQAIDQQRLLTLQNQKLLELTSSHLKTTPQGALLLNYVVEKLLSKDTIVS